MARVLEALQAHMWPGLVMKPQPGPGGGGTGSGTVQPAAAAHVRLDSCAPDSSGEQPAGGLAQSGAPASGPGGAASAGTGQNGTAAEPHGLSPDVKQPLAFAEADAFGAFLEGQPSLGDPAEGDDDEADRKFVQLMGRLAGAAYKRFTCACWRKRAASLSAVVTLLRPPPLAHSGQRRQLLRR